MLSSSHHFVGLCADDRIAFAGAVLETVAVEDFDLPAGISDQSGFLQSMGPDRNGGSPHAEHVREKLLGQGEGGASDHILRLQKPAAKPTTNRKRMAGCILPRLHQECRLIAVDQVLHVRMRMIGVHKLCLGHHQSSAVQLDGRVRE